jgi:ribose/xylose/arabinose/galactoside ABC-type transport system permease subunit
MTEHQATIVATRQVEASPPAQAPRENQRRGRRFGLATEHGGLLCVLLAACVVMTILSPNFLTQDNLLDVGRQISFTGIIALAMTMVIIAAEIDISVGSALAFDSAVFGILVAHHGWPIWSAGLVVLVVGTMIGLGAGLVRAVLNVPSFIVTLALFSALSGMALLLTDSTPIPILDEGFARLGNGSLFGIPIPLLIMAALFAVFWVMASRTQFGRSVYAIGGNPDAARLSGIRVTAVRTILFGLTGLLAALSGILQTSQLGAGNPTIGQGVEFSVITAVIVGGASLYGGRGSLVGTVLGVVFIGIINNGMVLMGVNSYAQYVANGAIVLIAVIFSTVGPKLRLPRIT